jgi:hypothetical protein
MLSTQDGSPFHLRRFRPGREEGHDGRAEPSLVLKFGEALPQDARVACIHLCLTASAVPHACGATFRAAGGRA